MEHDLHALNVHHGNDSEEIFLDLEQSRPDVRFKISGELLLELRGVTVLFFARCQPRFHHATPLVTCVVGNVQDSSTRRGCRSCMLQVTNFEDKAHVRVQRNALVRWQGQNLVVVHDAVH